MMRTPVAVFVFNRPAETSRVLDAIQRSRPSTLFVIADGPRPDRPADRDAVSAVRALFTRIEWPCEITTNFSEVNLGCRRRVSSGLDWVFEHADEAIILEDDTVPLPSFFPYCEELLDRYRFDARIGSISGTDFTGGRYRMVESYGLSRYNLFWGWATWKRAWSVYDDEMKPLDETGSRGVGDVLARTFELRRERLYWRHVLSRAHAGQIDSWGYRWLLSCWNAGLLGIQPAHSLVSNIGVGEQATHTSRGTYDTGELREMMFPLTHPRDVLRNPELDRAIEDRIFSKNLSARLKWFISRLVGR